MARRRPPAAAGAPFLDRFATPIGAERGRAASAPPLPFGAAVDAAPYPLPPPASPPVEKPANALASAERGGCFSPKCFAILVASPVMSSYALLLLLWQ